MDLNEFRDNYTKIIEEVQSVVMGQDQVIKLLLTSILAEGHCILTGVPGLGRTLIAESMGKVLGLTVNRIQFTPDLLPTDITGAEVIQRVQGEHQYRYVKGPVFAHLVLADEINRSPARTQAALLESMQEKQVTVSGKRYELEKPFLVIATQNTLDTEGVYPLPEAQLDRFLMQIEIKYPSAEDEKLILDATTSVFDQDVREICSPETVVEMQRFARVIPVTNTIKEFTAKLVRGSRLDEEHAVKLGAPKKAKRHWWGGLIKEKEQERVAHYVRWGASPRAGQALLRSAKVNAIIKGRAYVTREDIIDVAYPILSHRVIPDHRAGAKGLTSQTVVERLVKEVCDQTAPEPVSSRMGSLLVNMKS